MDSNKERKNKTTEQVLYANRTSQIRLIKSPFVLLEFWVNHESEIRMNKKLNTAWKVSVYGVFLVRIFPHSDWIWRDTPYLTVCSPNAGKCKPEILRIRTLFTQWKYFRESSVSSLKLPCYLLFFLIILYQK